MAYCKFMADRIRQVLDKKHIVYEEKDMMGRHAFHINRKFVLGVWNENLEARIDPEVMHTELKNRQYTHLDPEGRRMKGFIIIDSLETDMQDDLEHWIDLAVNYNREKTSTR